MTDAGARAGERAGAASPTRLWLHIPGNFLLGAALGLLVYYGVTNAVNGADQSALRAALSGPGVAMASGVTVDESPGNVLEFSGWETEDAPYWRGLAEGGAFGRIVIPAMQLDAMVVKGTATLDLRRGPGWIVTTDLPGPTGNCGISGHRTTYGHPFGRLNELKPGDTIDLYSSYRRYRYEVVRSFAVTPNHVEVIAHTEAPQLTLTACHPPYSARQRLIVQAKLVDVRLLVEQPAP